MVRTRLVRFGFTELPIALIAQHPLCCHSFSFSPRLSINAIASTLSLPRKYAVSGFVKLNVTEKVEEENVPNYKPENYYPVHIGDIFSSRYQVVSKLGFGVNSTVWLCRDIWQVHQ